MFGNSKRRRFEKLFQPHIDAAYNLARYLCGNAYDAEDIVQEAYMRAYRAFDNYSDDNSRAWILTITRNSCYSWLRRHNKNPGICFDEQSDSLETATPLTDSVMQQSPEQMAVSDCDRQQVRAAITSLPAEFREVAVLRELEGMTYQEIGLVLDIPAGTVMSRLARARKRLRELLANVNGQDLP